MDRFDTMRLFVRVVQSGSFSVAARETGVGQPAVSKQIAQLEARLGAQLLRRTSRSMTVTEAGQGFYEAALRLIDDLDAAESLVGRGQSAPSGLVRVALAPVFARLYVVPSLPAFLEHYPDISVELLVSERTLNLVEEGVDLAIHNGDLVDSSLIVRKLATTPIVTVGTPAYLAARGEPMSPGDLERHDCVIFAPRGEPRAWRFAGKFGPAVHHPKGRLRTADAEQIRAAVLAGLGLAHTPGWLFAPEIASGAVRAVLAGYQPAPLSISLVHPAGRRLPTKARVFGAFLAEALGREPAFAPS
ncbi:MAG: LysR family transcriptional regulator [Rhodospirillales bacterium 70-18]|nr:MAG: LysR family transcriptional regulator [Rhodospirillales bacterium 70-18]